MRAPIAARIVIIACTAIITLSRAIIKVCAPIKAGRARRAPGVLPIASPMAKTSGRLSAPSAYTATETKATAKFGSPIITLLLLQQQQQQ